MQHALTFDRETPVKLIVFQSDPELLVQIAEHWWSST
jgi:hypothetical protein